MFRDEPGEETTAESVLEGCDRTRRSVRREHDLTRCFVQGVEGVEELFLEGFGLLEKLDVVDQKDVTVAVAPLERAGRVRTNCLDEFVS